MQMLAAISLGGCLQQLACGVAVLWSVPQTYRNASHLTDLITWPMGQCRSSRFKGHKCLGGFFWGQSFISRYDGVFATQGLFARHLTSAVHTKKMEDNEA